jgi:hypothetical protein
MRINFMIFWHFLLFLFAAEDSSQWHGDPHIHTAQDEVANKVKCLFWVSLSIAFSIMFSKLH